MTLYLWICIWYLLCALAFHMFEYNTRKSLEFFFCLAPTLIIVSMRNDTVGTDTLQYVTAADSMKSLGYDQYLSQGLYSYYEPAFTGLLRICTLFNDPRHALIFISSILIIIPPFYVIYKIVDYPALIYCVYFLTTQLFMDMNAMRQSISVAFIYIAILVYSQSNKLLYPTIFIIFGSLFHYPALIAIIVIYLAKYKNVNNKIVAVVLFLVVPIVALVGSRFNSLFSIIKKYDGYLNNGTDYLTAGKIMPLLQIVIFGTMVLCCIYINNKKKEFVFDDMSLIYKMHMYASMIGICIGVCAMYINLFYRFMYDVLPFITIGVAYVLRRYKNDALLNITLVSIIILFYTAFMFVPSTWFGISEYSFYRC